MKPIEILVFGASGQIGRNLLRKLARKNFRITVVTRNIHTKGYVLKSQANAGWINIIELETFNYEKLNEIFKNKDICINLIGILTDKNKFSFNNIHCLLPKKLAELAKKNNLKQFIHLSALGIEDAKNSKYALSKLNGEIEIKNAFENYVILKPSIVYSIDDKFTTKLMSMLKLLPIFPIYYEGKTIFYPIHVTDMCEIIEKVIENDYKSQTIECIGPENISFKEIIEKILKSLEIKRFLLPTPLFIANMIATFFEISMKNPLLTKDQLILLNFNNSPSGKYKTNLDLKLNKNLKFFDQEILKYSYSWKYGGEFSKDKNKV
tara:strand:- start:1472 stop:2434 length:963 start_codon:yes stop_codon:yes gene_type:complete